MSEIIILIFAYILDLIIGDPKWLPHPVRIMGWGIERLEKVLRGRMAAFVFRNDNGSVIPAKAGIQRIVGADLCVCPEMLTGALLVAVMVSVTYSTFYILNTLLIPYPLSLIPWLLLVFLTSTTLATNDLLRSGRDVINALHRSNQEEARKKLSLIVGRDTENLDNKEILKATIETLSENASDGIVAPLFYYSIGGLPLAMAYKAVNTLDSMVGYRNEKYRYFGWAAARLDDAANYIPARITGILIAVSSFVLDLSPVTCYMSLKTMLRDGRKHLSPNSGIPEAAMAGALGIRLGGPSIYKGIIVEKPYIGEEKAEGLLLNTSEQALAIVKITSLLGFGLSLILLYLRSVI